MLTIIHDRGDTLSLLAKIPAKFVDGFFSNATVAAHLRASNGRVKVCTLNTQWVDPVTTRELYIHVLDTSDWPTGPAIFDVQFVSPTGGTITSDRVRLTVKKDITYAPYL